MSNNGIINIKGKDYVTVAKRVQMAHEGNNFDSLETEVLSHNPVVIKATVIIKGKKFTGISSVSIDSQKYIDKENPYEVAETSAVGRALGFANFGAVDSIASADEMVKAGATVDEGKQQAEGEKAGGQARVAVTVTDVECEVCGKAATEKRGMTKGGKPYHGIFCSTEEKSHTRWLWN